jgi:hypothetical protein
MKISLPASNFESLEQLSKRHGYTFAELVRLGLSAVKAILEAQEQGHIIVEATREGKALTEIQFPNRANVSVPPKPVAHAVADGPR